MTVPLLNCPKCRKELSLHAEGEATALVCGACTVTWEALLFPALVRPPPLQPEATVAAMDGDSTCFYHPARAAAVPCDACGRFLCTLCDVDLDGQHLCPGCLESGAKKGKLTKLENRRTLNDNMALMLSVLPFLITPLASLYITFRHWNTPSSIIPRSKVRFVLAAAFSILQLLGWGLLIYSASRN